MNEIKQIRMIQLAASLLLSLKDDFIISQANNASYDIIIETPIDKAVCLVRVVDDEIIKTREYSDYIQKLQNINLFEELGGNSLGLLKLDEKNMSLEFQMLCWDDWGEYTIAKTIEFHILSQDNISLFVDEIRKHYHVVKLLEPDKMMVVKHIGLSEDIYGHKIPAEIVYLREFKEDYKMSRLEPANEEEKLEKLQNGHIQRDYPGDVLDKMILDAVKTKHPNAKPRNSLLATNFEFRQLAIIKQTHQHEEAEIRLMPDLGGVSFELLTLLGTIEALRFRLDIYINPSFEHNLYDNEGYELKQPLTGWVNTLNRYSEVLNTLHRVNDFV